jgi:ribosomal protein L39E
MQQESRGLSSLPRKIPTLLLSSEEKLKNAGLSSRKQRPRKKKQERSSKDSKMKLANYIKLSNKVPVFLLVKTTTYTNS